jgi:hypothetical protein
MNKNLMLISLLGLCMSLNCVSLAPLETRQKSYIKELSGISKKKAYESAQVWFSKSFNDSKSVIQLRDESESRIIGKGILQCDVSYLPTEADASHHDFIIDFQAKENKIRIKIENILSYRIHPINREKIIWGPRSVEDVEKTFIKCFEPLIIIPLFDSITGKSSNDDNW